MSTLEWQQLIYAPLIGFGQLVKPRNQPTKELLNWSFRFNNDQRFIYHKRMPMNLEYFAKELAWYVKADKDDTSITEHAGIWKDMLNDDGTLISNYGYLLWGREDRPLRKVVERLRNDSNSRQAIVHVNRPEHADNKDFPCTMFLQFFIRGGELSTGVYMRSQDAVFGLRNDHPFFWFVAEVVASMLGIKPVQLNLTVGSFHVYERHWVKVREVVANPNEWQVPEIDWSEELNDVCNKLA